MDNYYYTTEIEKRKRGKHLTFEDRVKIQIYHKLGWSNRKLAKELNCSPSTIANELKRGTPERRFNRGRIPRYTARHGQLVYESNRKRCRRKFRILQCRPFAVWTAGKVLEHHWSLDECVGYARQNGLFPSAETVCTKTLYNALRNKQIPLSVFDLPNLVKRKRHAFKTRNNNRIYGRSIDERPEIPQNEFGHWEGDTVVGKKRKTDSVVFTLVEKLTGNYIAMKIPGRTTDAVRYAIHRLHRQYREKFSEIFKTITVDNGPEFAEFSNYEALGTTVYFAHPYSSWERPQNERSNGLLRYFIPKGHSVNQYTDNQILQFADELNAKPRRKLGFATPEQLFEAQLDSIYSTK